MTTTAIRLTVYTRDAITTHYDVIVSRFGPQSKQLGRAIYTPGIMHSYSQLFALS